VLVLFLVFLSKRSEILTALFSWTPSQEPIPNVHAHFQYTHDASIGAEKPPRVVSLKEPSSNGVVVVSVLVFQGENLLLVKETANKWYVPSDTVETVCGLHDTALDLVRSHFNGEVSIEGVVGLEHFPKLRSDWTRVTLRAQLEDSSDVPSDPSCMWWKPDDEENKPTLSCDDFVRFCSHPVIPMSIRDDVAFRSNMVSVVVRSEDDRVVLVERASPDGSFFDIPTTHIDGGENMAFAAARMLRSKFKTVLSPETLLYTETGSSSSVSLDGIRATFLIRIETKDAPADVIDSLHSVSDLPSPLRDGLEKILGLSAPTSSDNDEGLKFSGVEIGMPQ